MPRQQPAPQQTATQILDLDLANILAKAQSGAPLTAAQRKIVERAAGIATPEATASASDGPNFVANQSQLAEACGVNRQVISYHMKRPGHPQPRLDGRHDVGAWRSYLRAHGRLVLPGASSGKPRHTGFADALVAGACGLSERFDAIAPEAVSAALEMANLEATDDQRETLVAAMRFTVAALAAKVRNGWRDFLTDDAPTVED